LSLVTLTGRLPLVPRFEGRHASSRSFSSSDDLAPADDRAQAPAVLRERRNVLRGIAVDDEEIGEGPGRDAADPALEHHELGGDGCGLPQQLDRREDLPAQRELPALSHVGRPE
jgi:hypothetical protein